MHANFLDPYQDRISPVHSLDSRIKLVLVVAFILTSGLTPMGAWPVYILLLALAFSAELLSDLGIGFYLKRALLALPFILAALPVLFTTHSNVLINLPFGLVLTAAGLERFLSISAKSWISVQAAILLASTTSFPDILLGLRALGLPRLMVAVIGLMWRYLFVIVDAAVSAAACSGVPASPAAWQAACSCAPSNARTASITPCLPAGMTARCAACRIRACTPGIGPSWQAACFF
jgi:cobalt/nickel transport system permease protein